MAPDALVQCLTALDGVLPLLAYPDETAYYGRLRDVAVAVLGR
ncbi:hypothetical protein [Micromonospora sp. NPDC004704]